MILFYIIATTDTQPSVEALLEKISSKDQEENKPLIDLLQKYIPLIKLSRQPWTKEEVEKLFKRMKEINNLEKCLFLMDLTKYFFEIIGEIDYKNEPNMIFFILSLRHFDENEIIAKFFIDISQYIGGRMLGRVDFEVFPSYIPTAQLQKIKDQIKLDFSDNPAVYEDIKSRIKELILTPKDQLFPPLKEIYKYIGDNALHEDDSKIHQIYIELLKHHGKIIHILLPSKEDAMNDFTRIATQLKKWIEAKKLEAKTNEQSTLIFKCEIAQRGLDLLLGLTDAQHEEETKRQGGVKGYLGYTKRGDLPDIQQLYVLAYRLLLLHDGPRKFIETTLAETPNLVKQTPETIGLFLEEQQDAIQKLALVMQNISEQLPPNDIIPYKISHQLLKTYHKSSDNFFEPDFMPLIEMLFITMRGHNIEIENPASKKALKAQSDEIGNDPACAEGAHLNILKEVVRILGDENIEKKLAGVEIISCTEFK